MCAYRKRRGKRYTAGQRAAIRHVEAYQALHQRLGPIVTDVRSMLFDLPRVRFARLLESYGARYGAAAQAYAEKTMPRWRSGAVKLSGQTAERMIDLLPRQLDTAQRFALVKRLCEHHRPNAQHRVTIQANNPQVGLGRLKELLSELGGVPAFKYLPSHVIDTVTWLNDHDARAARVLLSEVDRQLNRDTHVSAEREFIRIRNLVDRTEGMHATQTIRLTSGRIYVSFHHPKKSLWRRLFE